MLVLALLAGVVTIAAPCTLPMLPILLGASVGQTSKARPVTIALGFVLSFSVVALALSAITRVFDFDPNVLRSAAAVLLVCFGLLMLWPAPLSGCRVGLAGPARRFPGRRARRFVLGTTLGLVWTPCADRCRARSSRSSRPPKIRPGPARFWSPAIGAVIPMLLIAWRPGCHHRVRSLARITPRLQQGWHRRDRLRSRLLLPIRHVDRGVADPRFIPTAKSALTRRFS
jgi:hypothetical protein